MINPQWLKLPMFQMTFHGPKDIPAIEVQPYLTMSSAEIFFPLSGQIQQITKLIFVLFFPRNCFHISCTLSQGDNMHGMSKLFSGKNKKSFKLSSAEFFTQHVER